MGMRFRKSVKICKGVRVNFSKSGASLSLGGRGHSVNYSKRGTRTTIGIPGTGISYSTNVSSHHRLSSTSHRSSHSVAVPSSVHLIMNSDGKVEMQDGKGVTITDPSVLRKIKATASYKSTVQNLESQRQEKMKQVFNEAKVENNKFIEIYKLSPNVDRREQYVQIINNLKPSVYLRKQFEIPYPAEDVIRAQLQQEAEESVHGLFFKVKKMRKEYVEVNLQNRLDSEVAKWKQQRDVFEEEESKNEASATERYNTEYAENRLYLENIINGDGETVNSAVESWIASCELPVEINVDYEWHQKNHIMWLDVDLPEIEDLPENEVVRLASGNLRNKKKTQATLKQEYVNLVFGLAIFISANIFNVSPAIHGIVISGYTQRRNKNGDINDEYVYSIKFARNIFENSMLQKGNPLDFCMKFENRCNITSTMLMKKIKPFDMTEYGTMYGRQENQLTN